MVCQYIDPAESSDLHQDLLRPLRHPGLAVTEGDHVQGRQVVQRAVVAVGVVQAAAEGDPRPFLFFFSEIFHSSS